MKPSGARLFYSPLAAAWFIAAIPLLADEPAGPNQSLRYRRIYVPASELNSQANGMIPLKREEFERRVTSGVARQSSSPAGRVRVERATYIARLAAEQLVEGTALLEIVNGSNESAPFSWESTLPMGKPVWEEQPPRAARLGSTHEGGSVLMVEKSGRLAFPWSLRGKTSEAEGLAFELLLSKATISRVVLQFPAGVIPETDDGIVSRLDPNATESRLLPSTANSANVNWLVELGGLTQVRLRARNSSQAAQASGVVLVRESATHVLSPVDANSDFELQLETHQHSLSSIKLELDAPARVTGVRLGGIPVYWREATAPDSKRIALVVEFPEILKGSRNGLSVSVVTPLTLDRVWQIPRLRMAGGAWQEGTATLVVPEGLQIGHLEFTDVRQTSISPGSPTQPEQTVQFQYLSVGGHVEIHPVRNRPLLQVMGGLVVRHESTQLAAVQNLDLGVNSGELFTVEGVTSDEWTIDSVETSPSEVLEERQFIPLDNRKFLLRLRLARPLTTKDRTRLVIRAHRQTPGEGEGITADDLRIVAFQDVLDEQLVVALRATDSSREFQLSGELDLFRIDPESAAPEELSLLEASAAGILIRLDRQAEGSRVSLVPSDPQFTALMESIAVVKRGKVEHSATIRITPTSSSLTRLVVRSSFPLPSAMRWQLRGASDLGIESQTLLPAQSPASGGQKESVWELVLNRITSQPFKLDAVWETSLSPGEVLPLFSVPQATAQDGLVRIEASQGMPLQLETEGVKPVPVSLPAAGFYSPTRNIFRYEPGRQATVRVHTPGKGTAISGAWVRQCVLHSRYALDGAGTHEITWKLENHGLDRFPFSFPPGVRPLQITINEVDATILPVEASTGQHFVPLPELRRYPEIKLTVSTAAPATSGILEKRWIAPLVTTSLPVLDRRWEIALPPGVQQVSRLPATELSGQWYEIWKARMWGVFMPISEMENPPFTIPWSESEPLIVSVYAPGLVRTLGMALAIAAASIVIWLCTRRLNLVFLFASLFAAATLLLPTAWSPLAAGLFWGLAAGSLLSLVRRHALAHPASARFSPQISKATMATGMTGMMLLLGAIRFFDSAAIAAPGDQGDGDAPAKIHRVIIPVDADQQPQGDYVYVAPDLYKLLYSAPEREHLPAWLIRSATYEFEASEDSSTANILMRFELETLAGQARISLPLRRGEIHLLEGRAALDGEPMLLDWNDAGTSLQLEVERPGLYQLSLRCSAAGKHEKGDVRWSLSIPKTPRSTLRIKSPTRPSDWVLPGAQGITSNGDKGDDLLTELGSSAILDVRRKDSRAVADNTVEAEQLIWWKIRPGSITADVVVRLRPVTGKTSEVKLIADPQLHLLPLENEPRVSRVWAEEGESNLFHLVLAEPTTETLELRLKFLLLNSSGVGKLTFPRLNVVADRKAKMWQAISVDKEIEISPDPQMPLATILPVEFVDSFGGAARPPNLAFEGIKQMPAFLLRPQEGIVRARETMDISLGRLDAEIHYRAELVGIPPRRFQEVIELPPGFHVKQAVILEQEAVASMHGATLQNNLLSIHRAQTPGSAQQIVIHGTLPLSAPAGQPNQVRLPSLQSVASDGSAIRIYRSPATLALIQSAVGIEPSAKPEGAPWDKRLGHLVASYKSAPSSFPVPKEIAVVVRPNEPAASYRLVTKMERTAPRAWSAVLQCDVSLESGSLDTVRFEVPSEWSGPFELTPPMEHQVLLLPGQTQRHLIIRPIDGRALKLSLSVRGPIKLQTGETPHAPALLPLDAARVDSFLLLPRRAADETFRWQTNGLQALATGEVKGVGLEATAYEAFRVVAPHFAATLQSKDSRKNGRIVLADLAVHPVPSAGYWSQASFYLLPGGRDDATLQLPEDSQMVQVLVNDASAEIRMQPDGVWRVRFCHDQLPQFVTVIYQHDQHSKTTSDSAAPIWPEFPVEKSTCTLAKPAAMETADDSFATKEAEGLRSAAVLHMAAVLEVVRSASDAGVSGLLPRELAAWLSLWRMAFARANQAAQLSTSAANDGGVRSPDRLETDRRRLEVEFAATLSRFADLEVASTPPIAIIPPVRVGELAAGPVISTGSPAPLPLASATADAQVVPNIDVSLVLLATALIVATLFWWLPFREWVSASPAYAILVFALVCLPSLPFGPLVSIFLVAVAVWFSLRRSWPRIYSGAGFRVHFPRTNSRTS